MFGIRNVTAAAIGIILFLAIFVGIPVAGWQLHWWASKAATNNQARINSSSYSAQQSDITTISDNWNAIQSDDHDLLTAPAGLGPQIKASRLGSANNVCLYDTYLTGTIPLSPDIAAWVRANCSGDAVSATSSFRNGT